MKCIRCGVPKCACTKAEKADFAARQGVLLQPPAKDCAIVPLEMPRETPHLTARPQFTKHLPTWAGHWQMGEHEGGCNHHHESTYGARQCAFRLWQLNPKGGDNAAHVG